MNTNYFGSIEVSEIQPAPIQKEYIGAGLNLGRNSQNFEKMGPPCGMHMVLRPQRPDTDEAGIMLIKLDGAIAE